MTRFIPDGVSTWAVMTRSKDGARSLSQTSKLPGMPLVSHWSKIALSLACESLQKQAMRPFPTYKKKSWSNRSRLETFNTDQSIYIYNYIYIIIIESLYIYISFKINVAVFNRNQLRHLLLGIVPNAHARLWRWSWLRANCTVARAGHRGLYSLLRDGRLKYL